MRKLRKHRDPCFMDDHRAERRSSDNDTKIPRMVFSSNFRVPPPCNLCLICGTGRNIDLDNVREGNVRILLAEVPVKRNACQTDSQVKIDFSTILKVDDNNRVILTIALRRHCDLDSTTLQEWELEFDRLEKLPFSFAFCDEFTNRLGCCVYTVEITHIDVRGGNRVDELKTKNTLIDAIVQV